VEQRSHAAQLHTECDYDPPFQFQYSHSLETNKNISTPVIEVKNIQSRQGNTFTNFHSYIWLGKS